MQKRKINMKKVIIFILIIVGMVFSFFAIKKINKTPKTTNKPKVISEIKGYELKESATSYYKNIFNDLKTELSKDEIDFDNYAKIISKLFISDCFTLDNKVNHNDIGGVQFVYEPFQSDFISIAKESLYHHVENNIYGNRKQELPVVSDVKIGSIENGKYEYLEKVDENAYFIKVEISYLKDLGYPKLASLIVIHSNDKLEIAELE